MSTDLEILNLRRQLEITNQILSSMLDEMKKHNEKTEDSQKKGKII